MDHLAPSACGTTTQNQSICTLSQSVRVWRLVHLFGLCEKHIFTRLYIMVHAFQTRNHFQTYRWSVRSVIILFCFPSSSMAVRDAIRASIYDQATDQRWWCTDRCGCILHLTTAVDRAILDRPPRSHLVCTSPSCHQSVAICAYREHQSAPRTK